MPRPVDNRLPPPPRDPWGAVLLLVALAVIGLGSLAIWAVS